MSTRSAVLLIAGNTLGLIHQVDHILRYDHSGWPFRPEVTPFTFSWLLFGLGLLPFVIRRPWLRLVPVATLLVLVQTAHIFIETPADKYSVWATGVSAEPDALGQPNLLQISSPLGYLAAGIALSVTIVLLCSLWSLAKDARGWHDHDRTADRT